MTDTPAPPTLPATSRDRLIEFGLIGTVLLLAFTGITLTLIRTDRLNTTAWVLLSLHGAVILAGLVTLARMIGLIPAKHRPSPGSDA